jgi:Flp pilus assembly protein TadD
MRPIDGANAMTMAQSPNGAPAPGRQLLEQVIAAVKSGDIASASRLAPEALAGGVEHPLLLNLRALGHEQAGRFEAALADLRRAHVLAPRDFSTLNACGLCLGRLNRHAEAVACFEQAIALSADFGPAWFNRGASLERLGETAQAETSYARAAEIHPQNAQAWANLAYLAARRGDTAAASVHGRRALDLQPDLPTAEIALAESEMATPARAETRLRAMLSRDLDLLNRGIALSLLGDALDAQDRPPEAFAAYAQGNVTLKAEFAPRFEAAHQESVRDILSWLNSWAERLDAHRWIAPKGPPNDPGAPREHVFLLGFPRSGTTLIETVLANHPDIATLEERETLHASVVDFLSDKRGLQRLASEPDSALAAYRKDYWRRVADFGVETQGAIFVDKNPFNTLKLPLIYKLFPHAKIIFAQRDPRDVVFSCFRRRFNVNASTYEFLDLARAAANYSDTMRFAEALRPKQGLEEFRLVYEDLIADFEGVARAVCGFIGVEWREDLLDIAARGRGGNVASASSAQIARGLYGDGAGQWRRYRESLAPILPVLAPWVARFGYPAD